MTEPRLFQWLADAVLALHVAIVVFVVGGLLLVVLGHLRRWQWVDAWWFRLVHLAAIAVVVTEAWAGIVCPLTTLEMWLRAQARMAPYSGGFIEHWLQRLLYHDAPPWVFTLAYSLFGLLVVATWWVFPPRRIRRHRPPQGFSGDGVEPAARGGMAPPRSAQRSKS